MKKSLLIATVILALVAVAVFYLNPRKTAELTITKVDLYYAQSTTNAHAVGSVIGAAPEVNKDLYVVVTLRIDNKLRLPIFLNGVTSTYTTPQDTVLDAHAISTMDETRLEETFPALKNLLPLPISSQDSVEAKSTTEGQLLFHFTGLTEGMWKQRKSANLTVNFAHQNPITIDFPK